MENNIGSGLRILIEVPTGMRQVLRLIPSKDDLYVSLPSGEGYEQPIDGTGRPERGYSQGDMVKEEKSSLHPRREEGGHAIINHHYRTDENSHKSRRYTHAPHTLGTYCPIITRRCMDLGPVYEVEEINNLDSVNFILGRYLPDKCSLFFMLYWCSLETEFLQGSGADFSLTEFKAGRFRVGMIWSFIAGQSATSFTNRLLTRNEKVGQVTPDQQTQDIDILRIIATYKALREEAKNELFNRVRLKHPDGNILDTFRDLSPYFCIGADQTVEYFDRLSDRDVSPNQIRMTDV